jgi:apolipoprotein N-acyltransferase
MLEAALPPVGAGWLTFLILIPLFASALGQGFAFGFLGGLGSALLAGAASGQGLFLEPSMLQADSSWNYVSFFLFGLVIGLMGGLVGEVKELEFRHCFVLAAWGVLFEAMLLLILPAHIALPLYQNGAALGIASVGGIWLVSYLVYLVSLLLVRALVEKKTWKWGVAGMALSILVAWPGIKSSDEHEILVAAVQTEAVDIETLTNLSRPAEEQHAQFIVWPELSAFDIAYDGEISKLEELSQNDLHSAFVTTYRDATEPMPHNVASIFYQGERIGQYAKRKPFAGEVKEHAAGTEAVTVSATGKKVRLNICFDSCFPAVMRDQIKDDLPDIILLPTLDPPGPYGTIQALHAAYSPFRAAELGVPIVRADITAYSNIVDSNGAIVAEAGSGTEEVITAWVGAPRKTVYRWAGDWFLYASILFAIFS